MRSIRSPWLMLAILALAFSACVDRSDEPRSSTGATTSPANQPVDVLIANYEIVVDESSRVLVGLVLPDNRLVAYGSIQMRFAKLSEDGQQVGGTSQAVAGRYLPVPGTSDGEPEADPEAIRPDLARGVYALDGVRFPTPGAYAVEVATPVQGAGIVQGATTFEVLPRAEVPGLGERAPKSDNPVAGTAGVDPSAIDSRAAGRPIPDPSLHRISIADAVTSGRPSLVVFSTPVYCQSRFCGPVTDVVQDLQTRYADRAEFIHVEVWEDFQSSRANDAANQWLGVDGTINEPWAFLIGADGKIQDRWDNLFTEGELAAALDELTASQ